MRILAWFTAGFAAVCLLCCYGPEGAYLPAAAALLGLMLPILMLRLICRARPDRFGRALSVLRRALVLCLGGMFAAGWLWGWTALFRTPAGMLAGRTLEISGTAASWPSPTSAGGYSETVELDAPAADVLVYGTKDWGALRPGDRVVFTARVTPADTIRGDDTTYYTARGIFLLGYANQPPVMTERPVHAPVRFWPIYCAEALKKSLAAAFDAETAPLAAALVTGDKSGLSKDLSMYMSRTGTAHAAVVSGMHVTSLVALFMILIKRRKRAAIVMLPVLAFYVLMTGGAPSAVRALVMQGVLLFAPFAKREYDPPTGLAFALLLLLLQNPYAAGSVSLQLSAASVAGILTVSPRLLKRWEPLLDDVKKRRGKAASGILRFVLASLSVSLGGVAFSQPVLAFYFGRASLVFPLANLLILWAVQALMPGALLAGTLGISLPGPARILGGLFGVLGHYIIRVVTVMGRWRFASVDVKSFGWLIFVAGMWIVLALWLIPRRGTRTVIPVLCVAALFAGALASARLPVDAALLTVTVLDVGQGSSTAFLSGGRTCLVDCGGNRSDSAGDIAADYFAAMGDTRLDLLALTHLDADHVNGLPRLFDRMEVRCLALPETEDEPAREAVLAMAAEEGAEVVTVSAAVRCGFGNGQLTLYPPLGSGTSNEAGMFALCSVGDMDVLVTGDADQFVEKMLIKYYDIPDLELLVVGHHGSGSSTSPELLDTLLPELSLISVGQNTYGHPSAETLSRLAVREIPALRTDELGTVSVYISEAETGYTYRVDAG